MGTGTDIRVGPAVKWVGAPTANTQLRATATLSLQDHRHVKFREWLLSPRPVSILVGADYDYKPTKRFYGIGNTALKTNLGYFLLESTTAEAALAFGSSPLRQIRVVGGYSSMSPRRGYNRSPLLEEIFPPSSVPYYHRGSDNLLYGVTADLASLDDPLDPAIGAHGHVELRRATGIRSSDPDYSQWWLEGRTYVPVFAKRRVLVLRGIYTGVKPRGGATTDLPFYRLPGSEGSAHFAGYNSGRFRDRQLMLARAEYRWPIVRRLNALALFEMGEVAPNMSSFRLPSTHNSYGGGLRLGLSEVSAFRLEMAQSVEGFHMVLELGSAF
jgi:outer membrane protein assembly factor BamA